MGQLGEWGEWAIWLMVDRWLIRSTAHLIALMLIVMTVETEQLPVAAVRRIIVMVVVFVMDRELAQLFALKLTSAVSTDPWE